MDMMQTFTWQNYQLQCSATAVDGGRFAPGLVVEKQIWPTRPRRIDVPRGEHFDERAAIEAAYAQGLAWIRDYG